MSNAVEFKNWFLKNFEAFENSLNGESKKPIHKIRKEAISEFSELNFPTLKDEEWKYTNISPLLNHNFVPSKGEAKLSQKDISKFLFDNIKDNHLVFVNGFYSEELSNLDKITKGVVVKNLSSAMEENSEIVQKHFGKYAVSKGQIFTSLSTAFTNDGAFIYVPDGKIVEEPIHIMFITDSTNKKVLSQPRNLFIAGRNSQVTIIEHYFSLDDSIYFTNSVTEFVADENAIIDHIKLQEESKNAFHIARMEVGQERSSNFTSHSISLGASIARNDFNSKFNDVGGECMMNGLFLTEDSQLFDTHTLIDHAKPHCNSHEHYKGILDDKSRGVFNGKVIVRQDAQKTNAFQENNNIILSNEALVNTKPQLEIFADDVKCSHGATIGQIDEEAMFYLNTRGIGKDAAKAMLIHAFASDVLTSIKVKEVREYLEVILNKKFDS